MFNRRDFCQAAAVAGGALAMASSNLTQAAALSARVGPPLIEVAQLEWVCNAVAQTADGRLFVGLPRWPGYEHTPSIAQVLADGSLKPFPGGDWNRWAPGKLHANALININTVHVFDDHTLWAVDMGEDAGPHGINPGQRILQFDTRDGRLLRAISLPASVLPAGGNLNDLRLDSEHAYLTDSGLGAIIVVNLRTGASVRRLAAHPSTKMDPERRPIGEHGRALQKPDGSDTQVQSDPLEISPDGQWLYYQPMSGPLWRVPTAALRDTQLTDKALGEHVQFVYDTGPITGTAMDSAGNLYLGENDKPRITVLSPDGSLRVLVQDPLLWNPDALMITRQRELYIPVPQSARLAYNRGPGGKSTVQLPFKIYKVQLPARLGTREEIPAVVGTALHAARV